MNGAGMPAACKSIVNQNWMSPVGAPTVQPPDQDKDELAMKSWRHFSAWDYRLLPETGKEDIVFFDKAKRQWIPSSNVTLPEILVYIHKASLAVPSNLPPALANGGRVLRAIIQNKVKDCLEQLVEEAFKLVEEPDSASSSPRIKVADAPNSAPAQPPTTNARPRVPSAPFLEPGEQKMVNTSQAESPKSLSLEKSAPPAEVNRSGSAETLYDGSANDTMAQTGDSATSGRIVETADRDVLEAAIQLGALHGNARVAVTPTERTAVKVEPAKISAKPTADTNPACYPYEGARHSILDWEKLSLWVFNVFQPAVQMYPTHSAMHHDSVGLSPMPTARIPPAPYKSIPSLPPQHSSMPLPPSSMAAPPPPPAPTANMHHLPASRMPHGAPMPEHMVHPDHRYYPHDPSHMYAPPPPAFYNSGGGYPHNGVSDPSYGNYYSEDSSSTAYYSDAPREPSPQFVVPPAEGKKIKARSVERNIDYNVQNRLYRYRVKHKGARLSGPWRRTIQEARRDLEQWRIQNHLRVPF